MYVTEALRLSYAIYFALVTSFMLWFVVKVRRRGRAEPGDQMPSRDLRELAFFGALVVAALIANAVTLSPLVPWQKWMLWSRPEPAARFTIEAADYAFRFPARPLVVPANRFVEFSLTSRDVTYGFGVFRKDGTMVFQLQVVPGRRNRFVWRFDAPGSYDVRSTEYSGPQHWRMWFKDAIRVTASGG